MAPIDPLAGEIRENSLAACYVFYGEEDFLAEEFIRRLKQALISPEAQGFNLETFDLPAVRWPEIIDTARTAPFFFSPWRIVVVKAVEENREGKEARRGKEASGKISSLDQKIIREYFRSPASRTALVVVITGRVKKSHPLVKFFDSLPPGAVVLREVKRLKSAELHGWMAERLASAGKSVTPDALSRLEEVAGSDLRRIDRELEKLVAYAARKKTIDVDDVLQVCAWTKSFIDWELGEALKRADQRQALLTLNRAFQEGERPERLVSSLANFFRDLLLAKLWLREGRDRKEVFAFLKPQIKEGFVKLYREEFRALFSLLEATPLAEISWAIEELERIDRAMKTGDVSVQALVERLVIEYCRRRQRPGGRRTAIWKARN
jgi:DNA polymerase III delta subunit